MGEMIWLEILSSSHEVETRHRFDGNKVTIGRGYDNHLIIDDPYVAPCHLLLERNADGTFLLTDQDTLNGFFLNKNSKCLRTATINDNDIIHLGDTQMRLRTASFPVPPEQPLSLLAHSNKLFAIIAAIFFPVSWWTSSLEQTTDVSVTDMILSGVSLPFIMLVWAAFWASITRTYAGSSQFLRHLKIALLLAICLEALGFTLQYLTYAVGSTYVIIAALFAGIPLFGLFIYIHLRRRGARHNIWLGSIIAAICVLTTTGIIMTHTSQRTIREYTDYVMHLAPPYLSLSKPEPLESFMTQTLETKRDADSARREKPSLDANNDDD